MTGRFELKDHEDREKIIDAPKVVSCMRLNYPF